MDQNTVLIVTSILGIAFVIISSVLAHKIGLYWDNLRIEKEIKFQKGQLLLKQRAKFKERTLNNRVYKIIYLDKHGHKHSAFVKTSLNEGVYFSQKKIIRYAQGKDMTFDTLEDENKALRLENDRLRAEIEQLKGGK